MELDFLLKHFILFQILTPPIAIFSRKKCFIKEYFKTIKSAHNCMLINKEINQPVLIVSIAITRSKSKTENSET